MDSTTLSQLLNEAYVPADQPKVIGDYMIDKVIGEGRFACVRAGIHKLVQGEVAVKTLSKFSASRGHIQTCLFYQESENLRKLQHRNIVRLYETMETKNTYYLVLEIITGISLATLLKKRGTLPEEEARHLTGQLAVGVHYMSKEGVVHRDIKPSNLMLRMPEIHLKIIDFGLSATCLPGQTLREQCGTPMYAAPEVFGKQPYTASVDVWSMGVVLCEMLTGISQFFSEAGSMNTLLKVYSIATTSTSLPSYISKDCADILKGMMCIDPSRRLTSAQVIQHSWLKSAIKDNSVRRETTGIINYDILHLICRKYNYAYRDVYDSVLENKCNHFSAVYYISLATYQQNGDRIEKKKVEARE